MSKRSSFYWFSPGRMLLVLLVGWLGLLIWPTSPVIDWYIERIEPTIADGEQTLPLTILDNPVKQESRARYLGQTETGWSVSITTDRATVIEPGSIVTVQGSITPIRQDDQRYFRSRAKDKIFAEMRQPEILEQYPAKLNPLDQLILKARFYFDQATSELFHQPYQGLFASILIGQRSSLPQQILDNFSITGLSHLIAVSGYNISLLIGLLTNWLRRLGQLTYLCCSSLIIFFFVVFTGSSASVSRAGIFAILLLITRFFGRKISFFRLVIYTASLMSFANPLVIGYDIGFQLSFAAVIGLALFADIIQNQPLITHLPDWLKETLAGTIAAQLTTLPLIIHYFQTVSLYSLIANLLVGPVIPFITLYGLFLLPAAYLPHGQLAAWPFDLALRYIIFMVNWLAALPAARFALSDIPFWFWLCYYATISFFYLAYRKKD